MTATYSSETGPQKSGFLNKNAIPLGVQLWSVKNDLALDFDGSLKMLAETGFSFVETAGYDPGSRTIFGLQPGVFVQKIRAAGMQCISAHAPVSAATIPQVSETFATTGIQYLITSLYPDERRTAEDYYAIAASYNRIGSIAKRGGIQFGYHNHHFEFAHLQGECPFDILLNNTDPELVVFESDLGWMVQAGQAPETWFAAYPGRFPLWHFRDVDATGQPVNAGAGIIDFQALHLQKKQAGFLYGIVETPSAATDGMDRVRTSFNYLKEKRLY
ncbi:sugar phosphate isomerase/epimerase family protein [Niabella aurantiaca]|uniref:sugar phosphate isomerase/epimerase family protein n=1 Tax=Niabella aurantiaca TaxID=379900 RepID=UPI0003783A36|nr:TIM barrel protein [Niabella aurantiaca]